MKKVKVGRLIVVIIITVVVFVVVAFVILYFTMMGYVRAGDINICTSHEQCYLDKCLGARHIRYKNELTLPCMEYYAYVGSMCSKFRCVATLPPLPGN